MSDGPADEPKVVKISRRDVEDARRLLSLLAGDEIKVMPRSATVASSTPHQQRVRELLILRRRRAEIFGRAMFGEPAWEMLLLLYSLEHPKVTISRLAELAHASKSTAIRWIEYLESQRLIQRESHPTDKRSVFVELTDKARELIKLYLSETLHPFD